MQNELSKQNIQDRYHGRNDPVAKKILNINATNMGLQPPEDQSIVRSPTLQRWYHQLTTPVQTSLFLSSLSPSSTEQSIRTRVLKSLPSVQPSQLKSVVHVAKTRYVTGLMSMFS